MARSDRLLNCFLPRYRRHDEPGFQFSSARTVMNRRNFLGSVAVAGLNGCAHKFRVPGSGLPSYEIVPRLMPIRAEVDRIFRVTVCLRPFRAAGPRLDVERVA